MTGRRLSKSRAAAFALLAATALATTMVAAPGAWSHSTAKPKKHVVKIRARIRVDSDPDSLKDRNLAERAVFFTPSVVNVGPVIIVVSNTDDDDHWIEINGVTSRKIGPGGRAIMRVTFKRPGMYRVGVSGDDLSNVGPGLLKVVK
jgi:hypothetical protein